MEKKKVSTQFYRQPRYYKDFSCTGEDCPQNCCFGWTISWEAKEIEKLKNAECSEHLRSLIDAAFVPNEISEGKYRIEFDGTGRCPLLTENNLCSVQKELGTEYLSYTCMIYPRKFVASGNTLLNCCNTSCYHVMDILCSDKDCMVLENYKYTGTGDEKAIVITYADVINHPELKYRQQLFEFFYEIISDDSHSLETSIVLGALAAQGLTKIVNSGGVRPDPGLYQKYQISA